MWLKILKLLIEKEKKFPSNSFHNHHLPDDLDSLKNTHMDYETIGERLNDYIKQDFYPSFEVIENACIEKDFIKVPIWSLSKYYPQAANHLALIQKLEKENKALRIEIAKKIEDFNKTKAEMNNILAELEEQKNEIEEKKNQLTRVLQSITQASKIQMALMHSEKDLQDIFPKSFLLIKPKDIVSGDFLWIGRKNNRVFVIIADCTGHGVPGAFMSMMGKLILNQIIIEIGLDDTISILNAIDAKVNKVLNYSAEGMELGILKFMTDENKIEFAGAHRPLCIYDGKEIVEIKGENNGVGGFHKSILKYFKKHLLNFSSTQQKKRLYLYSDGFPDQIGGQQSRKLTNHKFKELLQKTAHLPIEVQKQELEEYLCQWQGRHKQTDDIIVLGIEID